MFLKMAESLFSAPGVTAAVSVLWRAGSGTGLFPACSCLEEATGRKYDGCKDSGTVREIEGNSGYEEVKGEELKR